MEYDVVRAGFAVALRIDLGGIAGDEPPLEAGPLRLAIRSAGADPEPEKYDRKANATIFDAETDGGRTLVCRRSGRHAPP